MPVGSKGGGGGSSGDVRAGGAFVEIFTKDNALYRGLAAAESRLKKFGAFSAKIGAGLFGVGGGVLGGLGGILGKATENAGDVTRLADKLGVGTDKLQAFAFAAETTGISFEDLTGHFENFAERVKQGAEGSGEAASAFKRLGLDASALITQDPIDQMLALADAMGQVTNETERLGILSQFGGDQFQWLNTLFKGGSGGIKDLMQQARDVGAVQEPESVRRLAELGKGLSFAWAAVKGVFASVAAAIVPTREEMGVLRQYVVGAASGIRQFVQENAATIRMVALVAAGVTAAGVAFLGIGASLSVAGMALGGVIALFKFMAVAVAAVLSPWGLLMAAIAGGVYAFLRFTETGRSMLASITAYLADLGQIAKDTFAGIADAIMAGDLELAGKIAFQGLTVAWLKVENTLTRSFVSIKEAFVDNWRQALNAAELLINDWSSWAVKKLGGMGANLPIMGGAAGVERFRGNEERRILEKERQRQAEANDFRNQQIAAAERQLAEARKQLDELRNQAANKAGRAAGAAGAGQSSSVGSGFFIPNSAKGLFSGPFGQALGLSDKVTDQIAKNTAATAKAAAETATGVSALVGAFAFR
jgi:hypothetical protein